MELWEGCNLDVWIAGYSHDMGGSRHYGSYGGFGDAEGFDADEVSGGGASTRRGEREHSRYTRCVYLRLSQGAAVAVSNCKLSFYVLFTISKAT